MNPIAGTLALLFRACIRGSGIAVSRSSGSAPNRPLPARACAFHLILLAAVAAIATHTPPARADDASRLFLWEEANARMASAHTPDDYLAAARAYHALVADGARNGPLFYNLGTALLLAGDGENAAAALSRAERDLGSTPDIRGNLRQALALQSGQADADLPWDHVVFFWHYDEPLRMRALVALGGWLLLWLALLLRLFAPPAASPRPSRLRAFAQAGIFFGLLVFLVFGGSAAFTAVQEQMDARTWNTRTLGVKTTGGTP